jgi:hypothetical protein
MHIVPGDHEHPASPPQDPPFWRFVFGAWLGPVLLVTTWVAVLVVAIFVDILQQRGSRGSQTAVGLGWGLLDFACFTTIVACASIVFHSIRAIYRYFLRR